MPKPPLYEDPNLCLPKMYLSWFLCNGDMWVRSSGRRNFKLQHFQVGIPLEVLACRWSGGNCRHGSCICSCHSTSFHSSCTGRHTCWRIRNRTEEKLSFFLNDYSPRLAFVLLGWRVCPLLEFTLLSRVSRRKEKEEVMVVLKLKSLLWLVSVALHQQPFSLVLLNYENCWKTQRHEAPASNT